MTKSKLRHLKNEMLIANFLANFIGVFVVNALIYSGESFSNAKIWQHAVPFWIDALFTPFAFTFVGVMTLLYERPIRRYLNAAYNRTPMPAELETNARQRLLNEPFVLITYDFSMWLLSAIIYPIMHWVYNSGSNMIQSSLYHSLSSGCHHHHGCLFSVGAYFTKKNGALVFSGWRPVCSAQNIAHPDPHPAGSPVVGL